MQSFGLGVKLGSDLSQENKGIIYTKDYYNKFYGEGHWSAFTIISLSIGQGELSFTPLQICNACATIANRGYYIIPHIVKHIEGQDTIAHRLTERQNTGIDPKHFEPVIQGMHAVCEYGTGRSAQVPGIEVCGKTGTAQNPHGKDHSIFEAFAPMDKPKIAVAVYVENGGYGATYAAPIAGLMIEKYLKGEVSRKDVEKRMLDADLIGPLLQNMKQDSIKTAAKRQ